MINFETFRSLYGEAKEYTDIDYYTAERGWQDWMSGLPTNEITQILSGIFEYAHEGFSAVLRHYNSLKQVSLLFAVPYDTTYKWKSGDSKPAEYTIMMMAYITMCNR